LNNISSHLERVAIVCNITAGKGKSSFILKKVREKVEELKISNNVFTEAWPKNFDGYSSVWLIGGDGTLNYFINQYPILNVPVALFKGGTGNDFAWKLYGNKSVDEYFDIVLQGNTVMSDMAMCNKKYFINGVGIGFDGEVVKTMGKKRILPGHLGYLLTVVQQIFLYKEKDVEIFVDDMWRTERLFMITVANGSRYGGGFLVAPQSRIDDGELDIVFIKEIAPLKRISYLPKVERGKHLQLSLVEVLKKNKIVIKSSSVLTAHLDGELMESAMFDIRITAGKVSFFGEDW